MQKTLIKSLLLIIAFTFALSANYIFAVWTGPTQAPPNGNTPTPVHVGAVDQTKSAALALNSLVVYYNSFFGGNVGIGTTNPHAKLDVVGKIKVGNDAVTPEAGTIRFTGTDFEGYIGTEWKSLTASSVTTQAGLPFYGTNSTAESTTRKEQCQAAGGTVTDFQANSFCEFQSSSCSGGWTRYAQLGSTSANSCSSGVSGDDCGGKSSCTTGNHIFNNAPTETCTYYTSFSRIRGGRCYRANGPTTCTASIIQVGCY